VPVANHGVRIHGGRILFYRLGFAGQGGFLDARGRQLPPTPRALARLARVDRSGLDERILRTRLTALCDVKVPLFGPRGAELFMAQKGVRPRDLPLFRDVLHRLHGARVARIPGAVDTGRTLPEYPASATL